MANRIAGGQKVVILSHMEYRTIIQALEYTTGHEGRGNVAYRCDQLLRDLEPERSNQRLYERMVANLDADD